MICPIVTSPIILQIPSTEATREDIPTGQNLKETFQAHAHECVGMAANMIGVHKRIIVVFDDNGGVASVDKLLKRAHKFVDVIEMKSGRRFVKDEQIIFTGLGIFLSQKARNL